MSEEGLLVLSLAKASSTLWLRFNPFLLAPHARAVGPDGLADALVEESLPVLGRVDGESLHVVLDIEETAVLAPVDDVVDRVRLVLITREWHVLAVEKSALLEGSCEKGGEGQRGIWRNLSAGLSWSISWRVSRLSWGAHSPRRLA